MEDHPEIKDPRAQHGVKLAEAQLDDAQEQLFKAVPNDGSCEANLQSPEKPEAPQEKPVNDTRHESLVQLPEPQQDDTRHGEEGQLPAAQIDDMRQEDQVQLPELQLNDARHENQLPEAQIDDTRHEDEGQLSEALIDDVRHDQVKLPEAQLDDDMQTSAGQLDDSQLKDKVQLSQAEQDGNAANVEATIHLNSNQVHLIDDTGEQSLVIPDDKTSESDTNSEDLSCNDEQNNLSSSGSNSHFYQSSDSKIDYAVKVEDNDTLSDIDDIKTDTASADSEDSALGSLPPDNTDNTDNAVVNDVTERQQEAQDPLEGSDSGLGSEALEGAKSSFNISPTSSSPKENEIIETFHIEETGENKPAKQADYISNDVPNVCEQTNEDKSKTDSDEDDKPLAEFKRPLKSSLKRKYDDESNDEPNAKRKKENIKFDNVTVYYFPRAQGFSCVPSQGGSTLGMEWEHSHTESFTLAEHALEQRRIHRQLLQQLKNERHSLDGIAISSSEDSDTDEETSDVSESELDLESYYFLQPVPTRQRRALLRAAGVKKIEAYEKNDCRNIRTSREFCGCACKGVCNPENCSCSLGGIKCQVDRLNFPCGCTRDGCGNTSGRIEFNPVRVRTHFIHTLMRIVERNHEENQAAAKRHWAAQSASCLHNPSYMRNGSHTHDDGLVRDVNLTPRVEVESCVNNGSFNNVHSINNSDSVQSNVQTNMNYNSYGAETVNQKNFINENHIMNYDRNNQPAHTEVYQPNMLQGKGPPYSTNNVIGYDATNNLQRFPSDLNYSYEQQTDNNHFKGLHSYSATSFEEFAHNSQMSMFSHYGHMYAPDYLHKPSTSMHNHNSLQYHTMPHTQNHYEMYKNMAGCMNNGEHKIDPQSNYATLMAMPYQASDKLQTAENDQNWFSQSQESQDPSLGMAGLDQASQVVSEVATAPPAATEAAPESASETTENFGELIKNTMVESVTV